MNKAEANQILEDVLRPYGQMSRDELLGRLGHVDCSEVTGGSGTQYLIEVQILFDDKNKRTLRIVGSIDDGGLRSLFPITHSLLVDG